LWRPLFGARDIFFDASDLLAKLFEVRLSNRLRADGENGAASHINGMAFDGRTPMTSRFGRIFATALSAVLVAPVFAQAADVLLPPYDGSQPSAEVVTDDEALAVLHRHGIAQVSTLGRVGDYWEGEGMLKGKPVIAYVFTDGALRIQSASPGDRVRVQSAELPK
jgi:hypothetical protein